MSNAQLGTIIMAMPFLALRAGWMIGLSLVFRPARVVAQKERA
jgi:hypothetical protein